MIRAGIVCAALSATPAAAAVTFADLDPLTRGICEQLAINAQCPVRETEVYVPKAPTIEKITRPRPRPDWCLTDHAWRFACLDMGLLYGPRPAGPASPFRYYGLGGSAYASASAASLAWAGGGGSGGGSHHGDHRSYDRSSHREGDRIVTIFEEHWRFDGCGCKEPTPPPNPPVEPPTVIPLPGAVPVFLTAFAALAALRRFRRDP